MQIDPSITPLNVCLLWALIYVGACILGSLKHMLASYNAHAAQGNATAVAAINAAGGASGEALIFDDYFYMFCGCCVPLCCPGKPRAEVFRERGLQELDDKKLELHLNGRMVVNVAPEYKTSYWSDLFYYIFQKDHFLSCLYCDKKHPFTKKERWMVYFCMCCAVCMIATVCRPPASCEGWLYPNEPLYGEMHTWGRLDRSWTLLCTAGIPRQYTGQVAVLATAIIKCLYGELIKRLAYCPCFNDYVGTFKTRTEAVGTTVLHIFVFTGFIQIYVAVRVIQASPFKTDMMTAITQSIVLGIMTGWLSNWGSYHAKRVWQTGFNTTCAKCGHGVDQDHDGIECTEVCWTMKEAWNSQKDFDAYGRGLRNPHPMDVVTAAPRAASASDTDTVGGGSLI
jgi:hypothetical protein